jgi:hypothetical protein
MKRTTYIWLAGATLTLASLCSAQSGSLGDYARAARKENKPTATKTFDNDNLPKDSHLSVVGNGGETTTAEASNDAGPTQASEAPVKDPNADKAAVAGLKTKIDELKNKIDLASRELDVSQREYRMRAASFYADAGDRLRNSAAWDKEDADYKKKIADQQKAVDDSKKQLEDIQEELRKAGGK